ncbi:unnamed protein product [Clonostachys rosea]|uniref:Zn(2)-C6 fungal-type domain-containing protein n=1 Tax=Bionectria ochroleuca TaxID=29856 RepID=A0ABY6UJH4_BIOOC|nr:unnamed protein product [Clonostachys rosea]
MPQHEQSSNPPKRKRNARACDRCHKNASKCSPGVEGTTCVRCAENDAYCTYNRPKKRRGPSSKKAQAGQDDAPTAADITLSPEPRAMVPDPITTSNVEAELMAKTPEHSSSLDRRTSPFYARYQDTLKPEIIEGLVDVFYYVGYPLRPYFHWPTYRAQIQQQEYRSDWSVFIVTMAVCCLAAGRLNDGISISTALQQIRSESAWLSNECYKAAVDAMPKELTEAPDWYSLMKAKGLLASACLQNEQVKKSISHGGDYISISMGRGFHDEANWPSDLSERDKQERRRLFWGCYQHDQHMAKSFGSVARQREAKATVQYPAEVFDDSDISLHGIQVRPGKQSSFLRGWNFCTDLYRILEHTEGLIRPGRQITPEEPGGKVTLFLAGRRSPKTLAADSLRLVSQLYEELPDDLKRIKAITGDPQVDRHGFIGKRPLIITSRVTIIPGKRADMIKLASNVLITIQTLKMVLVGSEKPSVHLHCAIATELLDELGAIPMGFFHATSTVTLHHLAQVGHMLAGIIQQPVSAWTYLHVRNILLVLAEFLTRVESTRPSNSGLSDKLRAQISRIDVCMQQLSRRNPEPGLFSIGQTLLSTHSNSTFIGSPGDSDVSSISLPHHLSN